MKKILIILLFLIFSNCQTPVQFLATVVIQKPNGPVNGLLFTENLFPGEFNQANDVKSDKKGEGCITQVLFLAMWGDASAGGVAMENGIKRISHIDHRTLNAGLGTFSRYCTIVYGE